MKKQRPQLCAMIIGILIGMAFMADAAVGAAGNGSIPAYPAQIRILVDDSPADIEAYGINGTTFVRLVDVGKAVDFNVYWDAAAQAVRVDSTSPYTGAAAPMQRSVTGADVIRQEIIAKTNAVREKNGQKTLQVDRKLMEAAQVRATELAATTTYAHTRPDGRKFNTVTDCPYVGENIHRITELYLRYYDCELAETAVNDWVESATHLRNMLNPEVGSVGVGLAMGKNDKGEDAWYCVQLFMVSGCEITWVDEPILK